jgi:hypothetical protein
MISSVAFRSLIKHKLAAYTTSGGAGALPCDVEIHAILTPLREVVLRGNQQAQGLVALSLVWMD